ncbi:MAG: hypothetical protein R8P61_36430 [Bacteroidia bacterium]|nr:hypothetical protein [Bacteroidia bacterium]
MNELKDLFLVFLFFLLFLLAVPLFILLFLILSPLFWYQERIFKKKYQAYLRELEGKNFFCYNNRKKGRNYIEEEILPYLPIGIEVLFLNGRDLESEPYTKEFMSRVFHEFKYYSRFPQLLKIRDGKAYDASLNQELFLCLNQAKSRALWEEKMLEFFST